MTRQPAHRGQLGRSVGARQFFTLSFGTIIGVGWVIYLGFWLEPSGPLGAIIGFGAGTLLVGLIGLCYAEMAALFPVSGGEVAYVYDTYGTTMSFVTGWLLAIIYTSVASWEAISIGLLAGNLVPGIQGRELYQVAGQPVYLGGLLLGLFFMGFFIAVNYRGVKWAAVVQEYLMYAFFLMCIVFIGAAIIFGDIGNLEPAFRRTESGSIWPAIFATFITAPYFLAGFDAIPQIMEERSPTTPVKLAALMIVIGVLSAGVFYCVVIFASSMILPWERLLEMGELPAASAFEVAFDSVILGKMIVLAALIGVLTTWNAVLIAASRVVFALSRAWMIPPILSSVHPRFGTPTAAVFLVGLLGAGGSFLGRGGIGPIVNMSAMGFACVFSLVCVGVIRLRFTRVDAHRPFRVPGGLPVIALATVGAMAFFLLTIRDLWVNANGFPLEWTILLIGLGIGLIFWVAASGKRREISPEERRQLVLGDDPAVDAWHR